MRASASARPADVRIVVTGRDGQVAQSLAERGASSDHDLVFLARPELDLADPAAAEQAIAAARPDLVVSAAAYTAVDKAESEPALAMTINGDAPGAIARAAARSGAAVLHLSTDYVFDGALDRPYREDDPVGPTGSYGASKLAGERAVAAAGAPYLILRTAWVYSPFGANFVKTMLRLAGDRDEVGVVADQHGCPTSALDIADALLALADRWAAGDRTGWNATYHLAGTGETHWAGFAEAIFAASTARGGPSARVRGIATADYPTPARRPANSRLDTGRLAAAFDLRLPDWRDSLPPVVARLLEQRAA